MLPSIKKFFDSYLHAPVSEKNEALEQRLRIATVALLLETARADFDVQEEELAAVAANARQYFNLDETQTGKLMQLAEQEASDATCYYEFTSLINSEFTEQEKIHIIELMWQIAYTDKVLEKYEEALVRKIAELLYVPHSAFIASKLRAKASHGLE